jgi:hypothetical protein
LRRPAALALAALALAAAPSVASGDAPAAIGTADAGGGGTPPRAARFLGDSPAQGAASLLASSRRAADRHQLGLPSYAELLGRGWKRKAIRADARFARLGALPARRGRKAGASSAASPAASFERALGAKDTLAGQNGRQSRTLRVATSLDGGCPRLNPLGTGYGWSGRGRATYLVTTTERIGRFDLITSVLFDGSFRTSPEMRDNATAARFSGADVGEISITRNQVALDRRSGKRRTVGETERFTSALDPFYGPDGEFSGFVAEQEDGAPAPRRRLTTGAWKEAARWFMAIPYDALISRVLEAERLARTPNACVTIAVDAPSHLAPGQAVELTGTASPTAAAAGGTPLKFAGALRGTWINPRGQSAVPLSSLERVREGGPWYSFTAPPASWPDSIPVGIELELLSGAGIAKTPVTFKAEQSQLRFEVLDASIETRTTASRPSPYCGEVGGQQSFGGRLSPLPSSADNQLSLAGGSVSGGVEARVQASWHDHSVFGCRAGAAGSEPCQAAMPDRSPAGDGSWPINVSFEAAQDPTELTLVWRMDEPEIGFVDAGDAECNAHVWGFFGDEVRRRTIARSALQASGPITLIFAGSGHLDQHAGYEPASIDHVWDYELTIRRVGG